MDSSFYEKSKVSKVVGNILFVLVLITALAVILARLDEIGDAIASGKIGMWTIFSVSAGFLMFATAKASVLRQRLLWSPGSEQMSAFFSALYFVGCITMLAGFVAGFFAIR